MNEERTIALETKIAHQEHAIAELNDEVVRQQAALSALESRVDALLDRVRALSDSMPAGAPGDEPPPHY